MNVRERNIGSHIRPLVQRRHLQHAAHEIIGIGAEHVGHIGDGDGGRCVVAALFADEELVTGNPRARRRFAIYRPATTFGGPGVTVQRGSDGAPTWPGEDDGFSLFERLHQPFMLWWGNPERQFLNDLLREDLERAVDSLPEEFRATVVLVDVQGLSYAEVGEALDIPLGTVRSRLARGRARLQRALWDHARERGWVDATEEPQPRRRS